MTGVSDAVPDSAGTPCWLPLASRSGGMETEDGEPDLSIVSPDYADLSIVSPDYRYPDYRITECRTGLGASLLSWSHRFLSVRLVVLPAALRGENRINKESLLPLLEQMQ